MSKLGRREFMGASAAGLATAAAIRSAKAKTVAPSDQLGAGFIGLGRQGTFNMRKFLEYPDFRAVAVCDVYEPHLQRAKEETGAEAYRDFRRVLDRDDIDVVMIASPDHWHAAMAVMACDAGKDVYVEKPICVAVAEGRAMVEAARRNQRVVQV
ncbi:MAG: Gfo/Idh/MocA family oxidoreductase, partial [Acidobacteriota bacterium]